MRLFFQSVVFVLKLHLYKSLFLSVSLGQVWLTALRSKGKGKEILVSFKANQTAVTFFERFQNGRLFTASSPFYINELQF